MRRSVAPTAIAAALVACALAPAAAPAAWTTPRAATSAGQSSLPAVAADLRGRMAVGYIRTLDGRSRAEVRRGRTRDALRGGSIVLDRSTHLMSGIAVALPSDGSPLAVAWRRFQDDAHRLRAATIDASGAAGSPRSLTATGRESAYDPAFVAGADGSLRLVWTRRTSSAGRPVLGSTFGAQFPLPAPGVGSTPDVAIDADGATIVVWVDTAAGRVLAAQAAAGGSFGAPVVLSGPGRARDPQVTVDTNGNAIAAWLETTGAGNAVLASQRPRGGAFGPAIQVAEPAQRAFSPRLVSTSAGEVLLAWVNTNTPTGFGGGRGIVRLERLGAGGAPVGARIRLSPDGVRARQPVLAHDGSGSAFAGWIAFRGGTNTVQARRLAPGGITGAVRTLSRGAVEDQGPPALAGAAGRAVAAWVQGGDVRYGVYR